MTLMALTFKPPQQGPTLFKLGGLKPRGQALVVDPVCGMEVDESTPYKTMYKGKVYYFCSEGCLKAFRRDPEKYLREGPKGMPG